MPPETLKEPSVETLPVPSATRNAPASIVSPPLRAVAPVTVNVSPTVVAPEIVTSSVTVKSSPI